MKKLLLTLSFILASTVSLMAVPREEYPRPQFQREQWQNLNGEWTYEFDFGQSGIDRKLFNSEGFENKITVPFCPESQLSGVGYTDFIPEMWYHRTISMPQEWAGKQIMINFGGVDFFSAIYVDGKLVGRNWGGGNSFSVDVTDMLADGKEHDLVVRVKDDLRSNTQPSGKQSTNFYSEGCYYTRTTGIWQTVWMEPIDANGLNSVYIIPDLDRSRFVVRPEFKALAGNQTIEVTIKDGEKTVAQQRQKANPGMSIELPIKNVKTWSPESPFLYDIILTVFDKDNNPIDEVKSYSGMRKIHIEGDRYFLNNKPYYLRLVLDQGFYPEGIWTAPSDEALRRDIELSKEAGFNGARLHQKVFEERFHYWADKLGYLTWGEAATWGGNINDPVTGRNFLSEWESIVIRDRNHPSIITWTPFNESWERPDDNEKAMQHDRLIKDVYRLTHNLDYRPVNDVSGFFHVITDLWTVHNYEQDPDKLAEYFVLKDGKYPYFNPSKEVEPSNPPCVVAEFGGIKWIVGNEFAENSWGYGQGPRSLEEFYQRLEALVDVINSVPYMSGYCYTQFTDVEQEQNGIYNYDRSTKFDMQRIKAIFSKIPESFK